MVSTLLDSPWYYSKALQSKAPKRVAEGSYSPGRGRYKREQSRGNGAQSRVAGPVPVVGSPSSTPS